MVVRARFRGTQFFLEGPKLGTYVFGMDPPGEPNDLKLVAVLVGGDAFEPIAPIQAALTDKRFCLKLYAETNWVPQLGPQLGQRLGPRLGPSCLHLGPNWVPAQECGSTFGAPIGSLHDEL